jgi:two-component system, OmpR family, response regulator
VQKLCKSLSAARPITYVLPAMPKILVVDDDSHIRDVIRFALAREGHTVIEAENGARGLALAGSERPDLIVLDIMMPELDGTEMCRRLRGKGDRTPIVFLSARDDEIDRVLGLELGGDDYVGKPFSPRELVSRVKAILRRGAATPAHASFEIRHGRLRLDLAGFAAFWDDRPIVLTVTEFGLIKTLAQHPGKVFNRDSLMDGAYADGRFVSDRTVDSHIRRVRAKFLAAGGDVIETIHGLGYKLGPCG